MKFKIDKAKIISEFQSLAAVADKKQTLPILSNILIRCEADSIKLLSTDLEVELEVCLSGANIEQPGETTIPAKKAADIIRELPPLTMPNTGNMGLPICLFAIPMSWFRSCLISFDMLFLMFSS